MPPRKTNRIEAALRAVLPSSVSLSAETLDEVTTRLKVGQETFVARWAGEGWLKQVRQAVSTDPLPNLIVGRQLSPGGIKLLDSTKIGWADETGAASIATGTVVVSRTGNSPKKRPPSDKWKPSVVAVAESLLCTKSATVEATQANTGLSRGSVANALKTLANLGYLSARVGRGRHAGREVVSYPDLLSAYADAAVNLAPDESMSLGVAWQDPVEGLLKIGQTWTKQGIAWFATGAVASVVMAPFLTRVNKAEVYVNANTIAELESIGARAGLKPVSGGSLIIRPVPTPSTKKLSKTEDGLPVAPWPRVYADLRKTGVRGEEAAEHLEERYLVSGAK